MAQFEIKAYHREDGLTAFTLDADDREDAIARAVKQGLEVVSVQTSGRWSLFSRRPQEFNLLLFTQELRSLLDAGLSVIESIGALARKERAPEGRRLINALIRQLREGKSFSAALGEFPAVFPPLYVALTAASERTGNMASALARFIDYRSRMDATRSRVLSAAIYPALLLGVGGFVILFLMGYVVPRFSRVYEDFGGNLPLLSRLLMQWGTLLAGHGWEVLLTLAAFVVIVFTLIKRQHWSWQHFFQLVLGLAPMAGLRERYRTFLLARFYRTVGLLLQGGIPVVTAMSMARDLLDPEMQISLDLALISVRGGVSLSEALQRAHLSPAVASDLIKVGEQGGDMGDKMARIADFQDEETARWAEWFTRLFEPLLMLVIGLFIAFIVVLLYMPIFELAGAVK